MGMLYEYSKRDEFAYKHAQPEPVPAAVPEAAPQDEDAEAAVKPPISSADIAVSGAIIIVGFVALAFISAMVFSVYIIAQNPQLLEDNAGPLTFAETQDLIAPYVDGNIVIFMVGFVIYTLSMLGGVFYVGFRAGWDWSQIGLRPLDNRRAAYAASIGGLGAISLIGTTLIFAQITGALEGIVGGLRETVLDASVGSLVVIFALGIFALPFAEELIFRGVLFTWLKARNGLTYATIVTSFTYAFFNLTPLPFFSTVAIGIGAILVYERTESVWGAYLAHVVFNAVTVTIYLIALYAL
ncbi:MAG: type II CAAX endopeptidase family protein [Chloroflexota bacterium]